MSWLSGLAGRRRSLWLGGVLAVSLHALLLAGFHGRGRERMEPEPLRSRDNTPELLQFSSQPAPLTRLDGVPLPPARALPPPPGRISRGQGNGPPASGPAPLPQRPGLSRQKDQERRPASRAPSVAEAGTHGDSPGDWAMAMEELRAAAAQEPVPADAAAGTGVAPEGKAPVLNAMESPLKEAYEDLWKQARPHVVPSWRRPSGIPALAVEVRQASWRQVRVSAVPVRHGQWVVLPDQRLLLWLQGDKLYLLQVPRPGTASS